MKKSIKSIARVAFTTMAIAFLVADSAHTATQNSLFNSSLLTCGCLDGEGNFYPGPSGGGYCWDTYQGEPWCIP